MTAAAETPTPVTPLPARTIEGAPPPGSISNLAEALAKAQAEFPVIEKSKTATVRSRKGEASSYSYQYADLAVMVREIAPVLAKYELSVAQTFETLDDGAILLRTWLLHASGERLESTLPVPWATGTPQDLGSSMTYMRRYAYQAITGCVADEDVDGAQSGDDGPSPKRGSKPRQAAQPPANPKPAGGGQSQGTPWSANERAAVWADVMKHAKEMLGEAAEQRLSVKYDEEGILGKSILKRAGETLGYESMGQKAPVKSHEVESLRAAIRRVQWNEKGETHIPDVKI